jgi:hypothetical protein
VMSSAASWSMASTLGNCRPSIPAMTLSCSRTCGGLGGAKMVRMVAATISAEPVGTCASTLRRKCTLHRCQAAPSSTEAIAAFESRVGVGDEQLHAGQAAGAQRAQERGP